MGQRSEYRMIPGCIRVHELAAPVRTVTRSNVFEYLAPAYWLEVTCVPLVDPRTNGTPTESRTLSTRSDNRTWSAIRESAK
jgi:hypothetical protein